jgi:hypothetical protein
LVYSINHTFVSTPPSKHLSSSDISVLLPFEEGFDKFYRHLDGAIDLPEISLLYERARTSSTNLDGKSHLVDDMSSGNDLQICDDAV